MFSMVRKGLGQSMSESNVRLDPLEFGKERSIDVDPAAYDCAALTRIPTIGLRRTARLTLSERLLRGISCPTLPIGMSTAQRRFRTFPPLPGSRTAH